MNGMSPVEQVNSDMPDLRKEVLPDDGFRRFGSTAFTTWAGMSLMVDSAVSLATDTPEGSFKFFVIAAALAGPAVLLTRAALQPQEG